MANNEHLYGPYDSNWCRKFLPVEEARATLTESPNRYWNYLAVKIGPALNSSYLVKPYTGFTDPEHETFFSKSWAGQGWRSWLINSSVGFVAGKVFTTFKPGLFGGVGTGVAFVTNAIQPYRNSKNGPDDVRAIWENFWLSGKAIRLHWDAAVAQVHRADAKFSARGPASLAALQLEYPGWRPNDGSKPELPAKYV